jgi:hypothetical protein
MPLTRIDSAFLDLDAIGGIDFDVQSGVPTFSVNATTHRVGIGTDNPSSDLEISQDSSQKIRIYKNESAATPASNGNNTTVIDFVKANSGSATEIGAIRWRNTDTDGSNTEYTAASIASFNDGGVNDGNLVFNIANNGTQAEALRITSGGILLKSGQAALTSTSLSHPFQVAAAADANTIAIVGRAADDIGELSFYEADKSTKLGELQYRRDHLNLRHRVGDISFSAGGTTEKLRITSGGTLNVPAGIGPQIRFENSHGVTTDAAISTFDDGAGTLLCLGSNFYFNNAGAETRYNTSEESAGIIINRNGQISFNTGDTNATATSSLHITSGGNVGIGTSNPGKLLDVNGDALINDLTVGHGAGNVSSNTVVGDSALNANTTGSQNTAVGGNALQNNTTGRYSTALGLYALRSQTEARYSTGIGAKALYNNTTGNFNTAIGQEAGYYIEGAHNTILGAYKGTSADATLNNTVIISAGTTERMRINSSGHLGVGDSSPDARCVVYRPTQFAGNAVFAVKSDAGSTKSTKFMVDGDGTAEFAGSVLTPQLVSKDDTDNTWFYTNNSLNSILYAWSTKNQDTNTWNAGISKDGKLVLGNIGVSSGATITLDGAGGSAEFAATVTVGGGSPSANIVNGAIRLAADGNVQTRKDTTGEVFVAFQGGNSSANKKVTINSDGSATFTGNVGIGTTNPQYTLEVNGSFAATTKSFVIPHPTKPGYKLRHGSLEGPENGVYIRGRSHLEVINLPDYWVGLVDPDSITVSLTPIGPSGPPRVERIENNKVYVFSEDSRPLDYFYMVNAERADIAPLEVEIPE